MEPENEVLVQPTFSESPPNSSPQLEVSIPSEGLFLIPLSFLFVFSLVFLKQTNLAQALYHRIVTLRLYYQIPCFRCQFYKRNQYLQCAVQPCLVLGKEAVSCPDFAPQKGTFGKK